PDTPEYLEYYAAHPELEEIDEKLRIFYDEDLAREQRAKAFPENPFALAIGSTWRMIPGALGNAVDGPVGSQKVPVNPHKAAESVKGIGRYFGADLVRIGHLNPAWVYTHNGRWFYEGQKRGQRNTLSHRYAITMIFAQSWPMIVAGREPSLSSEIDCGHIYGKMAVAGVKLAAYIRSLGYPARAHHVANYQVLQVPIAVDAGVGELGRNGYVISKEFGPAIRLATVTTDLPMTLDEPVEIGIQDFCARCRKCAEACPAKAIPVGERVVVRGVRKWKLDEVKCYRFWNAKGADCFICMAVCPWTKPSNPLHRISRELASRSSLARSILIRADDLFFGRKPTASPYPDWLRP
ncbi:MAG: reductive dehalogenase, partial [Chloroflexi bacterium]|nr:reductive dehalogenase [Chloroflexota bacterium]